MRLLHLGLRGVIGLHSLINAVKSGIVKFEVIGCLCSFIILELPQSCYLLNWSAYPRQEDLVALIFLML